MYIKKVSQYGLLIILFVSSIIFYYIYFYEDTKKIKKNELDKVLPKKIPIDNEDDTIKNIIENLKYVSEDLVGNTYTVTAQSATLKEDKINEVQLFEVNAEIKRKDNEVIYIYSKTANYNKINNNITIGISITTILAIITRLTILLR